MGVLLFVYGFNGNIEWSPVLDDGSFLKTPVELILGHFAILDLFFKTY